MFVGDMRGRGKGRRCPFCSCGRKVLSRLYLCGCGYGVCAQTIYTATLNNRFRQTIKRIQEECRTNFEDSVGVEKSKHANWYSLHHTQSQEPHVATAEESQHASNAVLLGPLDAKDGRGDLSSQVKQKSQLRETFSRRTVRTQ